MLYINDQYYTKNDFARLFARFEEMTLLEKCGNKRIAVCTENVFEWLALFFFIREKGGSVVPIHPATPREAAIRIAHKSASHLLIFDSLNTPILMINERDEQEGVLVQMSSGTTGAPKCIERTWRTIEEELDSYNISLPVEKETVSIIACPVTHSYGLISGVLTSLKRGTVPIILTQANPKYVLRKAQEHPNHLLYAAPVLLHTLARLVPKEQKLHYVMTSGTLIPALWLETLKLKANKVLQQYGCSEAGCVALHSNVQLPKEMGYPLPHIKVEAGIDGDNPCEIILQTTTGTVFTKDLGYVSPEGNLCLLGRIDDMINVAGLNVYPQEVEHVFLEEPRIQEAVVYKKPDVFAGERVCVQFVAEEFLQEEELRNWCQNRLAPHQVPVEFIQVKEIPKLPNGKISRKLVGGVLV